MGNPNPSRSPAHGANSALDGRTSVSADYAINARVMQILTRRWVALAGVEVGTTDGVVLIKGDLRREPGGWGEGDDLARERFVHGLRSAIRGIPGVVDVVMEISEPETGAPWNPKAS